MNINSAYVLPSEPGLPPRALLMERETELEEGEQIEGVLATWSADMGMWTVAGMPIPQEFGESLTEHAKSLGVEW